MSYKINPFTRKSDYYEPAGEAANGLPAGGTAGQIIKKDSATNYDASWADQIEIYAELPEAVSGKLVRLSTNNRLYYGLES